MYFADDKALHIGKILCEYVWFNVLMAFTKCVSRLKRQRDRENEKERLSDKERKERERERANGRE